MGRLLLASVSFVAVGAYLLVSPSPAIDALARVLGGIMFALGGSVIVLLSWVELNERKSRTGLAFAECLEALERLQGKQDEMMEMIVALRRRLDHVDKQWSGMVLSMNQSDSLLEHQVAAMRELGALAAALRAAVCEDPLKEAGTLPGGSADWNSHNEDCVRARIEANPAVPEEIHRVLRLLEDRVPGLAMNALRRVTAPNKYGLWWELPYWVQEPKDVLPFLQKVADGEIPVRYLGAVGQTKLRDALEALRAEGKLEASR